VLENLGNNDYNLSFIPCMCIYSVVNVETLKLYNPFKLNEDE
jgi:hypothetical protein